ncbi:hypothetical protein ACIBQ1_49965 [Nonomuraea sp. NPDC050153]|uniref:hypothetical protein n=1 Tax=Nonomuraea sp. NPDC050153 TaxID=3364359 RepID=UPI003787FF0B
MERSWISRGVTAAAMAGITLLSATPASAESYWSTAAPTSATSVGNLYEKTVTVANKKFTVQLRSGKWSSYTYIWARAPKNSSANGNHLYLSVYNPSTKKWEDRWETIKNTTYTDAHRARAKYGFKACAKQPGLGGSPAVCTSTWWV